MISLATTDNRCNQFGPYQDHQLKNEKSQQTSKNIKRGYKIKVGFNAQAISAI